MWCSGTDFAHLSLRVVYRWTSHHRMPELPAKVIASVRRLTHGSRSDLGNSLSTSAVLGNSRVIGPASTKRGSSGPLPARRLISRASSRKAALSFSRQRSHLAFALDRDHVQTEKPKAATDRRMLVTARTFSHTQEAYHS